MGEHIGLTPEQLEMRKTGLGASEIPMVAGLVPFKGSAPIDVWLKKTGRAEDSPQAYHQEMGHHLEPIMCRWYGRETGRELEKSDTLRHPKHEWLLATPDRVWLPDRDGITEAKHVGLRVAHHWEDGLPDYVTAQVLIQQEVTGIHRADVVVWFDAPPSPGGEHKQIIECPWMPDAVADLIEIGEEFWHEYVLKDRQPPIDASESWGAYLRRKHPRSMGEMLPGTDELSAWARRHIQLKADEKQLEADLRECAYHLIAAIGDADGIRMPGEWRATYKSCATGPVSWKAVAQELIERSALSADEIQSIIEKHTGQPARSLLVREE